ncbi:aspartate-semialdehyde dehydrogenase [Buchnera aphidicola (Cinara tujafilina)]|uniref:Aspartate-semialdehyde dehydrogenase n=1 Tax=Buchnera aphidicola (Cinara tujafilina) TaxID=261317 RepID=F7WZJ8_9GAMM|nr:aspartate-semialdehyde dehydrogenase [Buchnera aphidicola]AEH39865.1 aspartate-semialdehyde dehydrogenase [Buchnera aphidicola (Cinara tujafilina)]
MKKSVGFIGWRGMVGSVLLDRMQKNNDFKKIKPVFFTTSQVGHKTPSILGCSQSFLEDAYNIEHLKELDIILSCQGTKYTLIIYKKLRKIGWKGYWIDASSALRLKNNSIIVLDPINMNSINCALQKNIKTFVGGNCTVSLMLMALGGLFQKNIVDWVTVSTYQAVSGGGAKYMLETLKQMGYIYNKISLNNTLLNKGVLEIEKIARDAVQDRFFPKKYFTVPLAGSLIPWIDIPMKNGQSKEEWKGAVETNKILDSKNYIPIDGTCVRVDSLRCHSQSFVIKLKNNISIKDIELWIDSHNPWVKLIKNTPEDTKKNLTPAAVTGTLNIPIGRVRKLNLGKNYITAFSVGDQLLWGAAEPLRRILNILISQ